MPTFVFAAKFQKETKLVTQVRNLSKSQLKQIQQTAGETFATNELFHNWGTVQERRKAVMEYMALYVECVYRSGSLYANQDLTGFIGLEDSAKAKVFPKIKMLGKMLFRIEFKKLKSLANFAKQIEKSNQKYSSQRHIDTLMVCVDKACQGKGIATELVSFAKQMSKDKNIPLLFDTDMKSYSDMYVHLGCTLYNTVTADNGVTRYSLCYPPEEN